jgi:hypothetical protein
MDVSDVDTVMVDGRVVKRAAQLIGFDLESLYGTAYEARDRLFARADVPYVSTRRPHDVATTRPAPRP